MHVYRYPHYGHARPGTNVYARGGHAYGGWSGGGGWGATNVTPAAVAMIPEPRPLPSAFQETMLDRQVYAATLKDRARAAQAASITAAALNDPFAFAAQRAAAQAMATQARDVSRGDKPTVPGLPPQASERAQEARAAALARGATPGGMGRGIPWAGKTTQEKTTTVAVGASGVGAAWMLLL